MSQSRHMPAIVLRRTNYGEADRVVQLLTPEGRWAVMAKGVRRQKSKLAGGIELFALCDVVVRRGRGDLAILVSARLRQFYRHILDDYDRMQCGYQVLQLVRRASEQVDEPAWFAIVQQVFAALDQPTTPQKLVETWFYLHYTALLGDELNLHTDVMGHTLAAEKLYMYDASERALRPSEQGDLTANHIKLLRLMQTRPLAAVAHVGGVGETLPGCWLLVRQHSSI